MRPPNKDNAALAGGGAAKEDGQPVNIPPIPQPTHGATAIFGGSNTLIAQLDAARDRIDRAADLLNQSFDIRECLHFGLDVDDARAMVAAFKRDCRLWRPYEEAAS